MLVATFWHATVAQSARCVAREIETRPEVNRVLQWNFGRMGVITRFYVVVAYAPGQFAPMSRDYLADMVDRKAAIFFAR